MNPAQAQQVAAVAPRSTSGRRVFGLLTVVTALLLHLAVGYRPLPSFDDFAYLPVFRHVADPTMYARDTVLQDMSLHSLGWYALFRVSDATVGVGPGFWLATVALAVATVAAAFRIARALGAGATLLPLLGLVAFASSLNGIGRGAYDGAFGAAFHGQWLALCLLLFSYEAFLRERAARSGVFLGLAALSHISVAIHGGFVLALATMLSPGPRWKSLLRLGAAAAVVSLPALVTLLSHLAHSSHTPWTTTQLIENGYQFRLSHEYTLDLGPTGNLGVLLLALAAAAGALLLAQSGVTAALRRVLAIVFGQACLLALAALCFHLLPETSVLPYLLSLTRTSPLLLVLLGVIAVSGFDHFLHVRGGEVPFRLLAGAALGFALALLLRLFGTWNAASLALLALAVVLVATGPGSSRDRSNSGTQTAGLAVLAAVALLAAILVDRFEEVPSPDAAELFEWSKDNTPRDALFIVPPGLEEFRWFAERGVYVDFKLFPPASIDSIATWRQRLDEVAAPDRRALSLDGWRAAREYDRCYATRNTPDRIAELLTRTGASYFVWDADGLRIPPLVGPERAPAPGLAEVFHNARFTVYRLLESRRRPGDA